MNELSSFSHYHPAWQGEDFDRDQYVKLLTALSNKKAEESFSADGKSIAVVGRVAKMLQTIKGWLGFENHTDPVKVNYELLKLLQYGETQDFLSDKSIKDLVGNLQQRLVEDRQAAIGDHVASYETITSLITGILKTPNSIQAAQLTEHTISLFKTKNEQKLKPARWTQLFNTYLSSPELNAAKLHDKEVNILISLGKFSQAIPILEKALRASPNHLEWQLKLVALKIKEGLYSQAVASLQEISTDSLKGVPTLEAFQHFIDRHPELKITPFQKGSFIFNLASRNNIPLDARIPLLAQATEALKQALSLKQEDPLRVLPLLFKAELRFAKCYDAAAQPTDFLKHLKRAGSVLQSLKQFGVQSPFFNTNLPDFKAQAELIISQLHAQGDYREEAEVLLLLISLYQYKEESQELSNRLIERLDHVGGMGKAKEYLVKAYKKDPQYTYLLLWADCEKKIWESGSPGQVFTRLMDAAHQHAGKTPPQLEHALALYETALPVAETTQKRAIIARLIEISQGLEKENIELCRRYFQLADRYMKSA